MATKPQVFGVLAAASAALSREELGEKVGQPVRDWQTQLKGWMDKGFIKDTGDQHYVLTDKGREEALKQSDFKDIEDEIEKEPGFASDQPVVKSEQPQAGKQPVVTEEQPGLAGGENEPTQESLATTEYQQFLKIGKSTGVVPLALIKQTADYVWGGGDWRNDMTWVLQAMKDMDIREDLRNRWWNSWRVRMHKGKPADLPAELLPESKKADEKSEAEKKAGTGKRDYIMGENDNPTYVGEGLGDLDHAEALDLAKIRAGAKVRGAGQSKNESPGDALAAKAVDKIIENIGQGPNAPVDEAAKFIAQYKAFMELQGLNAKPVPDDDLAKFASFYKFMKEITGDNKQAINPNPVKQYLVDNRTGEVKEVAPGQPMVFIRESAPQNPYIPIQIDKDGKPVVPPNLETWLRLEDFRGEQQRKQESHDTKMDIAKGLKEVVKNLGGALSEMGGEKK